MTQIEQIKQRLEESYEMWVNHGDIKNVSLGILEECKRNFSLLLNNLVSLCIEEGKKSK